MEKFKPKQDRTTDRLHRSDLTQDFYVGMGGKESTVIEKLPAVEVKNEVVWVNKNIESPFNIKKGESNRLGMFFTPGPKEDENPYNLEIKRFHLRTGILGRIVFKDSDGRLYRDIDLKGIGYVEYGMGIKQLEISHDDSYPGRKKTLGILSRPYAENDVNMAEKFLKAGIRTYRPLTLIKLGEVIDTNGDKISIGEAKKQGLVKRDEEPVVEVRAFGTRARIEDLATENSEFLIEDSMKLVAQELGIDPENFSKEKYLDWFIKTMAVNLARMHKKNWIHGYPTEHNITLDARIIDLDSVETTKEISERKKSGKEDTGIEKSFQNDVLITMSAISFLKRKLGFNIKINFDFSGDHWNRDREIDHVFNKVYDQELKNED